MYTDPVRRRVKNAVKERPNSLLDAKSREFDLVVIGGGIGGAGVAQYAAARGMSVLLLEKGDFASGASGRSNQLVHGDWPYLEQLRFAFARKQSDEREKLKRLAPHLVKDISFVMPLARNNTLFNFKATVGLGLYDVLTMSARTHDTHPFVSEKKLSNLAPALSDKRICGAIQFHDAITDDARFVLGVINSAVHFGATVVNYVEASGINIGADGKIAGVKCHDRYSGEEFVVRCKLCVNAGGAWIDDISRLQNLNAEAQIVQSKSTKLIVPASAFETNTALLLPACEGHYVFIAPWQHALIIGAAEGPFKGSLENVRSDRDEIDYLLGIVNGYSNNTQKLNRSDVKATFSSVIAKPAGANEYAVEENDSGLISVIGAQISNYTVVAEEALKKLILLDRGDASPLSRRNPSIVGWNSKEEFPTQSIAIETKARRLQIAPAEIQHLICSYGSQAEHVVDLIEQKPTLNERIVPNSPVLMAEIPFCIISEMTVSLQDFFLRRTRLGVLDAKQAMQAAPKVAAIMAKLLNWDSYRIKIELNALEQELLQNQDEARPVSI
jgi:glycerol-3-phosphate dehydrogenase